MYPRTHPLSHFSRVPDPTAEPTAGTAAAYPAFRGPARAPAVRATLRAGDVLYLPPFWAHHAACERQCVAANVWVSSDTMLRHRAVEQARHTCWMHASRVRCIHVPHVLEAATLLARTERLQANQRLQAPLPFEAEWQGGRRAAAALLFLRLLLQAVHEDALRGGGDGEREGGSRGEEGGGGGGGVGPDPGAGEGEGLSAVVARHLDSRWRHAASLLRSDRGAAAAEAAAAECEPSWLGAPLRDKFARYAVVRAAALAALEPEVCARCTWLCFNTTPNTKPENWPRLKAKLSLDLRQVRATLVADQLDLLADWGGGTPAAAHALLERLRVCCRAMAEEGAVKEEL